jgi:hypothetical protein
VRIEARLEQPAQQLRRRCVATEGVLDVGAGEREPDLMEIERVGTQHLDLASGQPSQQHQPVEAVDLDAALELGRECPLEFVERIVVSEPRPGQLHQHVVQRNGGALVDAERERSLVDGPQPERVQHRQQVGQRQGLATQVHAEPHVVVRSHEARHHGALVVDEFRQRAEVDGSEWRRGDLVVAGRQRC